MNYMTIKQCDIANGTGIRLSLFVSGCPHHCPQCFNQEAWEFNAGKLFTDKEYNAIMYKITSFELRSNAKICIYSRNAVILLQNRNKTK